VAAVVLTYRRPRLATQVVRGLIDREGLPADRVLLVVNGDGGLDDPALEAQIAVLRLPDNLGPAGGYRAGLEDAVSRYPDARWLYLCEDDVGLFDLPAPRVVALAERVEQLGPTDGATGGAPVGGVVAYGRDLDRRRGTTTPHEAGPDSAELEPVDVAAWGASLVSRRVVEAGVLPDADMFFGYEDFDFWFKLRAAGFRLLLDTAATRALADGIYSEGRDEALSAARPVDDQEPWRRYYEARNFFVLRRRYGTFTWTLSHLVKSVRRMQLSPGWAHRAAIVRGVVDGFRGRTGRNDAFVRGTGEWTAPETTTQP
jgi:hypothetical protein